MNSDEYKFYNYNRSKSSYLSEWDIHNIFYDLGIYKSNARSVYFNKEFKTSKEKIENFIYKVYDFLFIF